LILLGLSLPEKNGHVVLAEIKQDPKLKLIPVIILTTSDDEHDILKSYELHANLYISKPTNLDEFLDFIGMVETFCSSIVRLPPASKGDCWNL